MISVIISFVYLASLNVWATDVSSSSCEKIIKERAEKPALIEDDTVIQMEIVQKQGQTQEAQIADEPVKDATDENATKAQDPENQEPYIHKNSCASLGCLNTCCHKSMDALVSPRGVFGVACVFGLLATFSNFIWGFNWTTHANANPNTTAIVQEAGGVSAAGEVLIFGVIGAIVFREYQKRHPTPEQYAEQHADDEDTQDKETKSGSSSSSSSSSASAEGYGADTDDNGVESI